MRTKAESKEHNKKYREFRRAYAKTEAGKAINARAAAQYKKRNKATGTGCAAVALYEVAKRNYSE